MRRAKSDGKESMRNFYFILFFCGFFAKRREGAGDKSFLASGLLE